MATGLEIVLYSVDGNVGEREMRREWSEKKIVRVEKKDSLLAAAGSPVRVDQGRPQSRLPRGAELRHATKGKIKIKRRKGDNLRF